MVFKGTELYFHAPVVAVLEHGVEVDGAIAAVFGVLDVVVDNAFDDKWQPVAVFQYAVVEFIYHFGRRHYAPAAGDVLGAVDLHLGEANEFAHYRLYALDTVGADAVLVNAVRSVLDRCEDDSQWLFVTHAQFLQHEQVALAHVGGIGSYPVAQAAVFLV